MKICGSLPIKWLELGCPAPPGGPPGGPPPPGSPLPPGGPPPPGDPNSPPGARPPDVPGPYDVDAMLVLLICAGVVIVVIISLEGNGIDSANPATAVSSRSSGGCMTIFLGLLGLLSVYPIGGGHGWEGSDGGVLMGFGESWYSPAFVLLRGMSTPRSAPASQKASQCSSCLFQHISTQHKWLKLNSTGKYVSSSYLELAWYPSVPV